MEQKEENYRVKLKLPLGPTNRLVRWANAINGFYGHPVYLVGSQITGVEDPRDIDVVCILPDEDFEIRYGSISEWVDQGESGMWKTVRHKWSQDCVKKTKHGIKETRLDIDFKVVPKSWSDDIYKGIQMEFPPVRLDTNPDEVYPDQLPKSPTDQSVGEEGAIPEWFVQWMLAEGPKQYNNQGTRSNDWIIGATAAYKFIKNTDNAKRPNP